MSKPGFLRNLSVAAALAAACAGAGTPATAQIRALLPSVGDVEPSAPLPIDGMWIIREIDKRIVIENGYAYAVDSWVHALAFRIMPDQIIMRNMHELPGGTYVADNLPMMSRMLLVPTDSGTILATTQGANPVTFHFDPVGFRASPRSDPGYDQGSLPPGGEWLREVSPSQDPDAGEEPVDPWSD